MKNRFMGPVLILASVIIVMNVVFQEILELKRVRHIVSSKRVTVQIKESLVISNI